MRLVIIGDGVLRDEAIRILEEGGVGELAWFAGERTDIPEIMRGLDCFVLPSRGEGISNTILEAMASAIPVVATRVGGNVELVEDGHTGRLVPDADPVALAQAIVNYFEDPATARRHGQAGRSCVEQNFSLDRMVDGYHELYLAQVRASRCVAESSLSNLPSARS